MKRKGFTTPEIMLWVAFGLVIFFVVFTFAFNQFITYFYGECMTSAYTTTQMFRSELHELEYLSPPPEENGGGIPHSDPIEITLGDCVANIAFVNADRFYALDLEITGLLECTSGYQAYIIVGPNIATHYGWKFWEWWDDTKDQVKLWFMRKMKLMGAFCLPLFSEKYTFKEHDVDGDGVNEPIVIDGPKQGGTKTYCVTLWKKGPTLYDVTFEEGMC